MKKQILYGFGTLLLVVSFALSKGSAQAAFSDPTPPCSPTGCPPPGLPPGMPGK